MNIFQWLIVLGAIAMALGYALGIGLCEVYEIYKKYRRTKEMIDVMRGQKDIDDCKYFGNLNFGEKDE